MNFKIFLTENAVEDGFASLKNKIHSMFDAFKKAAVNTWGKGNLNQKVKSDLVNDLYKMIGRLQNTNESIQNIENAINEAEGIASGLSPRHISNDTGRKVFDISDVLNNMETKIMQQVDELQRNILMKKLDTIDSGLAGINKRLESPPTPIHQNQLNTLHDSIEILNKLKIYNKNLQLVHNGKVIPFPSSNEIRSMAYKDANFKLKYGNKEIHFNIGDIQDVESVTRSFYKDNRIDPNQMDNKWKTKPFGAVSGNRLRPVKVG